MSEPTKVNADGNREPTTPGTEMKNSDNMFSPDAKLAEIVGISKSQRNEKGKGKRRKKEAKSQRPKEKQYEKFSISAYYPQITYETH